MGEPVVIVLGLAVFVAMLGALSIGWPHNPPSNRPRWHQRRR